MGWLDEIQHDYQYKCLDGHVSEYEVPKGHDRAVDAECQICGKTAEYIGLAPITQVPVGKVSFDQNGRKAFRIQSGNGKVSHMSQSKYHFMETGKIETRYTPEYEAHLRKDPEKNANLLGHDPNRRMGAVSDTAGVGYTRDEMIAKAATKKFKPSREKSS